MWSKQSCLAIVFACSMTSVQAGGTPNFPAPGTTTPPETTTLVVGYAGSGVQNKWDIKEAVKEEMYEFIDRCSTANKVLQHNGGETTGPNPNPTGPEPSTDAHGNPIEIEDVVKTARCLKDLSIFAGGSALEIIGEVITKIAFNNALFDYNPSSYNIYTEGLLDTTNDASEFMINSADSSIYSVSSTFSPAYADFKGKRYIAFSKFESKTIRIAERAGNDEISLGWMNERSINGHKSGDKPSLAVFNDHMYLAFKGSSSKKIYITSTADGINWTQARQINSHQSSNSPTLAVVDVSGTARLVAGFRGASSKNLYFTGTYNGVNWNSARKVGDQSSNAPYLAEHKGALFAAFKGSSSDNLYIIKSNDGGLSWSNSVRLSSAHRSNRAPAIASYNGMLYLVYKGISTNDVKWITSLDGLSNWSSSATVRGKSKTSGSLTLTTSKLW